MAPMTKVSRVLVDLLDLSRHIVFPRPGVFGPRRRRRRRGGQRSRRGRAAAGKGPELGPNTALGRGLLNSGIVHAPTLVLSISYLSNAPKIVNLAEVLTFV